MGGWVEIRSGNTARKSVALLVFGSQSFHPGTYRRNGRLNPHILAGPGTQGPDSHLTGSTRPTRPVRRCYSKRRSRAPKANSPGRRAGITGLLSPAYFPRTTQSSPRLAGHNPREDKGGEERTRS